MTNPLSPKPTLLGSTSTPSLEVGVERLGPAGIRGELNVLAQCPDDPRSDAERFADNSIRLFEVDARLSKSPMISDRIAGDFTELDGGSYLLSPGNTDHFKLKSGGSVFEIKKNAAGEMSFVHFECKATNPDDAHKQFLKAVLPVLDHFSYVTNTPILIDASRVNDPKNHRVTLFFVGPFGKFVIEPQEHVLFDSMRPVYAMYREARNSNSDFYKFLCFYKILEGLLGSIKAKLHKEAQSRGVKLTSIKAIVPDHPNISAVLRPYVGKSIKKFFDEVLTPRFRNAMTHFETDDGTVLHMSDPEHLDQYANIMLICELCVRIVIARHESDLRQVAS